jgi:hypothetical protein
MAPIEILSPHDVIMTSAEKNEKKGGNDSNYDLEFKKHILKVQRKLNLVNLTREQLSIQQQHQQQEQTTCRNSVIPFMVSKKKHASVAPIFISPDKDRISLPFSTEGYTDIALDQGAFLRKL